MIKNDTDDTKGGETMTRNRTATPVTEELELIETDDEVEEVEAEEVTFSAKELAAEVGTDPKSFRRWLRSWTTDRAEKGGRWIFDADRKAIVLAAYAEAHAPAAASESE